MILNIFFSTFQAICKIFQFYDFPPNSEIWGVLGGGGGGGVKGLGLFFLGGGLLCWGTKHNVFNFNFNFYQNQSSGS